MYTFWRNLKHHLYITNELIYYANRMRKMGMAYILRPRVLQFFAPWKLIDGL